MFRKLPLFFALAAGVAGCGPERYALKYQPQGAAPVSAPKSASVYLGSFDDAAGAPVMTYSTLKPSGLTRNPASTEPATFDPPLAAVFRDAATAELTRDGFVLASSKDAAQQVLNLTIKSVAFDTLDDTSVGGGALLAQRAAIVVSAVVTDRSGRELRAETLQGSGDMRRFGSFTATREIILNRAVAQIALALPKLLSQAAAEPEATAAAPSGPAPWWETPISK